MLLKEQNRIEQNWTFTKQNEIKQDMTVHNKMEMHRIDQNRIGNIMSNEHAEVEGHQNAIEEKKKNQTMIVT